MNFFSAVEIPTPGPVEYVNRSINADVSVEIVLVVDNLLYQKFGGNVAQISEYYAIFVRSMNIRYATSSNPTVSIKITGIVLMEVINLNLIVNFSKSTI